MDLRGVRTKVVDGAFDKRILGLKRSRFGSKMVVTRRQRKLLEQMKN